MLQACNREQATKGQRTELVYLKAQKIYLNGLRNARMARAIRRKKCLRLVQQNRPVAAPRHPYRLSNGPACNGLDQGRWIGSKDSYGAAYGKGIYSLKGLSTVGKVRAAHGG